MQNYCKTIGALAAVSALAVGNASAEIEYEIHAGYTTEYLFRGVILGDDLVEAGFDVATEVGGFGLSAGAWYGSFQKDDTDFDELDLYAEVSRDLGFATAAIGYISYQNLRDLGEDAQEVYFSLARDFGFAEISLTYFWDVEYDNDGYTELAASRGFELSPCLTLQTGVALAYLWEECELAHVTAKIALDYAFTETATVSPFIAHSWALTEEGAYEESENEFVGGAMLSVSF